MDTECEVKEGLQCHGTSYCKFPTVAVHLGTATVGHKVEAMFGRS